MNSILKDVTERNGNIEKGYYEEKKKIACACGNLCGSNDCNFIAVYSDESQCGARGGSTADNG